MNWMIVSRHILRSRIRRLREEEDIDSLLQLLSDSRVQRSHLLRLYAVHALGRVGDGRAVDPLSHIAIAVDSSGNVWVADTGNSRIQAFKANGEFIRKFGSAGTGNGQLQRPKGLAFDSEGELWVADSANNRLQRFSPEGAYLAQFGTAGPNDGQFSEPAGVAIDGSDKLWIADTANNRVQEWHWPVATTNYSYDQAGNLTALERNEVGGIPAVDQAMDYDATGLLVAKTTGITTRHLAWDASASLPLLLEDGQNSYVYGPNGLPIEQIDSKEEPTYLHHDQLGSTRLLTDATGKSSAAFSYRPYGDLEAKTGTATTPLGFAGQLTDAETGLQYLRARFYDPRTGQFLSRDPIEALTHAPYSYAGVNPINRSDPSGLCNANPFSGGFWTEGNCVSESPINFIDDYEKEIEAWENGASYWEAVLHGLEGAGKLGLIGAVCTAPAGTIPDALGSVGFWFERLAYRHPNLYGFLLERASKIGTGPPVISMTVVAIVSAIEELAESGNE